MATKFLKDKNIYVILSSPYGRVIDIVKKIADAKGFEIDIVEDFCPQNFYLLCCRK